MRYGYFDTEADEYVIERPDVPASWVNYLGVGQMCTVLSHNAGGYSFYQSSESGRITRFRPNAVPLDRPGHYVYLRDDDDGDYWSISWQPVGKPLTGPGAARYRTRHGLSYSVFECDYRDIAASQCVFIPLDDDVELWDVHVTNNGDDVRTLSLFSYVEFSFHTVSLDNQNFQMSLYASGADCVDGIIEYDFYYEPWTYHFFTSSRDPIGFDTLRDEVMGPYRSETNPVVVENGVCTGSAATTSNHCGTLHHRITLQPGQTQRLTYLLGYGARDTAGRAMRAKYAEGVAVDRAFADLGAYWRAKQDVLEVHTPSEAMNTLLNTWTLYQAETCVVHSRFASFVETGGRVGLGFRDTAQDVLSVAHTNPTMTKQRLIQLLRGQMSAGYGLHLFDPALLEADSRQIPAGVKFPTVVPRATTDLLHGIADACSDDHLWLVPSVVNYVKETGETDFLSQVIPFADDGEATVYDHLRRAIDFTAGHVGAHGVAEGLRADWNDCLNLGGGESALVEFLQVWAINALREAARFLGRAEDDAELAAIARTTSEVANQTLWDGQWYLRGYTADGAKIGSREASEGKIFLEHMPWATIAGIAPRERAISSMDAVWEHLGSEYGTHLNWPSFTTVDDSIGYVTRVYPGIKENGAIFSHPNAWPIIAEAMLGRGDRAMAYYDAIAPIHQNDNIEVRGAEPYVYVQFIYGRDHPWFGKAQNPWLTGSAGWMYTAATTYILGVRPDFDALIIDPCIPTTWPGFSVQRRWRGATYQIEVRNPDGVSKGVREARLNGRGLRVHDGQIRIPRQPAGSRSQVVVHLG